MRARHACSSGTSRSQLGPAVARGKAARRQPAASWPAVVARPQLELGSGSARARMVTVPMGPTVLSIVFKASKKLLTILNEVQLISLSYSQQCQLSGEAITKSREQLEEKIDVCQHGLVALNVCS